MAMETIDIKIRAKGDDYDWGSKLIARTTEVDIADPAQLQAALAAVGAIYELIFKREVEEFRWNLQGSQQGHYYPVAPIQKDNQ